MHLTDIIAFRYPAVIVDARMQKASGDAGSATASPVSRRHRAAFRDRAQLRRRDRDSSRETGTILAHGTTRDADARHAISAAPPRAFRLFGPGGRWHTPLESAPGLHGPAVGSLGGTRCSHRSTARCAASPATAYACGQRQPARDRSARPVKRLDRHGRARTGYRGERRRALHQIMQTGRKAGGLRQRMRRTAMGVADVGTCQIVALPGAASSVIQEMRRFRQAALGVWPCVSRRDREQRRQRQAVQGHDAAQLDDAAVRARSSGSRPESQAACNLDPEGLVLACAAVQQSISRGHRHRDPQQVRQAGSGRRWLADAFRLRQRSRPPGHHGGSPAMMDAWTLLWPARSPSTLTRDIAHRRAGSRAVQPLGDIARPVTWLVSTRSDRNGIEARSSGRIDHQLRQWRQACARRICC